MKKLFFTSFLCLLISNSFAGTLTYESSFDRYVINAECADSRCDEYNIFFSKAHKSGGVNLERHVRIANDKQAINDVQKSICRENSLEAARVAGLYMIAAGPIAARSVGAFSNSKTATGAFVEKVCAFGAGVAFNIVAFPYFAGRGGVDIYRAIQNNRGFAEALNVLLFTDQTLEIDHEVNHLIVNEFIYSLEEI